MSAKDYTSFTACIGETRAVASEGGWGWEGGEGEEEEGGVGWEASPLPLQRSVKVTVKLLKSHPCLLIKKGRHYSGRLVPSIRWIRTSRKLTGIKTHRPSIKICTFLCEYLLLSYVQSSFIFFKKTVSRVLTDFVESRWRVRMGWGC